MISKFRPAYLLLSHLYSPFSNPTLFPAMVKLPSASRIRSLATVPSSATRAFATVNPTPPAAQPTKSKRRFEKLDDGLTFDDFLSGDVPPENERVVLGNTKQYVFSSPAHPPPRLAHLLLNCYISDLVCHLFSSTRSPLALPTAV